MEYNGSWALVEVLELERWRSWLRDVSGRGQPETSDSVAAGKTGE